MTDEYPPFRLDQGGREEALSHPRPAAPAAGRAALTAESTRQPPTQISKCRCGPLASPVWPTRQSALAGARRPAARDRERVLLAVGEEEGAAVGGVDRRRSSRRPRPGSRVSDDRAGQRRDDGRALGGEDVLALVDVAGASGAEAAPSPPTCAAPATGKAWVARAGAGARGREPGGAGLAAGPAVARRDRQVARPRGARAGERGAVAVLARAARRGSGPARAGARAASARERLAGADAAEVDAAAAAAAAQRRNTIRARTARDPALVDAEAERAAARRRVTRPRADARSGRRRGVRRRATRRRRRP